VLLVHPVNTGQPASLYIRPAPLQHDHSAPGATQQHECPAF